ncbi:AP-3 complex subunit beta-2 [Pseudohyphozyma bogoriensis]|nr:AP-3 complex subunit beta-2 [Pseudohyphozyma bogoriensis]
MDTHAALAAELWPSDESHMHPSTACATGNGASSAFADDSDSDFVVTDSEEDRAPVFRGGTVGGGGKREKESENGGLVDSESEEEGAEAMEVEQMLARKTPRSEPEVESQETEGPKKKKKRGNGWGPQKDRGQKVDEEKAGGEIDTKTLRLLKGKKESKSFKSASLVDGRPKPLFVEVGDVVRVESYSSDPKEPKWVGEVVQIRMLERDVATSNQLGTLTPPSKLRLASTVYLEVAWFYTKRQLQDLVETTSDWRLKGLIGEMGVHERVLTNHTDWQRPHDIIEVESLVLPLFSARFSVTNLSNPHSAFQYNEHYPSPIASTSATPLRQNPSEDPHPLSYETVPIDPPPLPPYFFGDGRGDEWNEYHEESSWFRVKFDFEKQKAIRFNSFSASKGVRKPWNPAIPQHYDHRYSSWSTVTELDAALRAVSLPAISPTPKSSLGRAVPPPCPPTPRSRYSPSRTTDRMASSSTAEKTLNSLKNNATRLGQRLGENLAEHSRDLGLIDSFASGSGGGAGKYLENGAVVTSAGIEETKRMLASKRESERMEGLKRVTAMMTKNLPVTSFFPLVTSLLSPSTPLQARTLISLYIVHCASTSPELALLSINAYQKDLSDPNPIVRAGAIRTLSSMGLDDIRSLVGVALTKGARDGAWFVRRATADAVSALWKKDKSVENRNQLIPTLVVLLQGASPLTIGSALAAWEEVCPGRWDLVHPEYRKWAKMVMDVEEWGQCVLLRVLTRYGRTFFRDPDVAGEVDVDAELVLKASEPLLQHINPSVVSAVIKLHYYLSPVKRQGIVIKPLIRLLSGAPEAQTVALEDCLVVAEQRPDLLTNHVTELFARASDSLPTKRLRLRILAALANDSNVKILLKEFLFYVKDWDDSFSAEAIAAIGACAKRVPAVSAECTKTLIKLAQGKSDAVIAQSVLVLRSLLRSTNLPGLISRPTIIRKLVLLLEAGRIKAPVARANIYWLVGQYAAEGLYDTVAPDAVRLGVKGFAEESIGAKLQLLTLAAKTLVLSHLSPLTPNLRPLALLFSYLTTLARYDLAYKVRDRARFLKGLLASGGVGVIGNEGARVGLGEEEFKRGVEFESGIGEEDEERTMKGEQVRKVLFEGKGAEVDLDSHGLGEIGSFSLSLPGRKLAFHDPLAAYSTSVPPSSIRDVVTPVESLKPSTNNLRAATPVMNLKGFGSDSMPRVMGGSGRASPVVLVPTSFASGTGTPGSEFSREASPMGARGGKMGFVDLDDFYKDDASEEDEEDEEESEEDEEEEEEEESEEDEEG